MESQIISVAAFVLLVSSFSTCDACFCTGDSFSKDVWEGEFKSPQFPANYCPNFHCEYEVEKGDPNTAIAFSFNSLDTEPNHDYILLKQVENGVVYVIDKISGSLSQHNSAPYVTAEGNRLLIEFKTDGSVERSGYRASFVRFNVTAEIPACPKVFYDVDTSTEIKIGSPFFPVVKKEMQCYFIFESTASHKSVNINFASIILTGDSNIKLFEHDARDANLNSTRQQRLAKICDPTTANGTSYASRGHRMRMVYYMGQAAGYGGFEVIYSQVDSPCNCIGTGSVISTPQLITSPGYPEQEYCDDLRCKWDLRCDHGKRVQIHVLNMTTEERTDLLILSETDDHASVRSERLQTWSGEVADDVYSTNSRSASLQFNTDGSVTRPGFEVQMNCLDFCPTAVCPSPQPMQLPGTTSIQTLTLRQDGADCLQLDCLYDLVPPTGATMHSLVVNYTFRPAPPHGFVDFEPVSSQGPRGIPSPEYKRSLPTMNHLQDFDIVDKLRVHYHSIATQKLDSTTAGFLEIKYIWRKRCECLPQSPLKATRERKRLTSPDYPQPYCHNMNCTWIIRANEGEKVSIQIKHFKTEAQYDGLYVYNGSIVQDGAAPLKRYQGEIAYAPQKTYSQVITLYFKSDASVQHSGYVLEYFVDGPPITPKKPSNEPTTSGSSFGSTILWMLIIIVIVTVISGFAYRHFTGINPISRLTGSSNHANLENMSYSHS